MLSNICVFLKKNNRKAAKPKFPSWTITFPDKVHHWKSRDSAEPQTLCNNPQLWILCSKPSGLLLEIIVTELLFRQNLISMRQKCYVLFSIASSLLPWLVSSFEFPSLTRPKLFCCLLPWCPAPMLTQEHALNILWDPSFPSLWLCYSSTLFFHRFL